MKSINTNVKSMNTENIVPITICKYCLFSKSPLKRIACTAIKIMVKIKLVVPTLRLVIKEATYGMQINGEVPKFALIDSDAPSEIMNSDIKYIIVCLLKFLPFVYYFSNALFGFI